MSNCPFNHRFGIDADFYDDCTKCRAYDECDKAFESRVAKGEGIMYYVLTDWMAGADWATDFKPLWGANTLAEAQVMAQAVSANMQATLFDEVSWNKVHHLLILKETDDDGHGNIKAVSLPVIYYPNVQQWFTTAKEGEEFHFYCQEKVIF